MPTIVGLMYCIYPFLRIYFFRWLVFSFKGERYRYRFNVYTLVSLGQ